MIFPQDAKTYSKAVYDSSTNAVLLPAVDHERTILSCYVESNAVEAEIVSQTSPVVELCDLLDARGHQQIDMSYLLPAGVALNYEKATTAKGFYSITYTDYNLAFSTPAPAVINVSTPDLHDISLGFNWLIFAFSVFAFGLFLYKFINWLIFRK